MVVPEDLILIIYCVGVMLLFAIVVVVSYHTRFTSASRFRFLGFGFADKAFVLNSYVGTKAKGCRSGSLSGRVTSVERLRRN